ncbi:uncharacterized protein MONBRDRAFT_13985 [Monosiga brevicollis MX1]|uniref:Bromodomain-containing protein n=1 Tax=Monosiga brevicollis TaxID=81824 RepID=A9UQC3_MONBE|nr:uncharacterized protein MONBRDRAFT_13985 [Monosiga brevicollis MX1]EDQ92572.1 predicted protein [Monosiga brevicollis MX1]|eukprot:XP_001742334.1 hypothetical protein [Monosiga brevicollis MX1]
MADAAGENNGVDEDRDNKPESVASPAPAPSATAALLAAASTDDGTASPQGSATPGPGTPSVIMAPGTPDSGSAGGTPRTGRMTNQLQYISKVILPTLNKHPSAWPFKKPVDWKKLGLLSYPEIIANPMDLGTIRNKLRKKEYFSGRECLDDIELVWHNCQTFNRPSDDVYIMSQALESDYKQMLANLPEPEVPLDRPSAKAKSAQAIKAAPALIVPSLPTHRRQSSRVIRAPKDGLLAASSRLPAHMRVCYDIIKDLFGKKHQAYAWPFYEPVDIVKLNIPDYYDVIKQPMDLGTVRTKLEEGEYETRDDFAHDVRLVFANCYTYNPPGSDVVKMAKSTSEVFELQWAALDAPAPATPAPTSAKSSSKPAPKKPAKKRAKAPPKKAPPKSTPAPAPAPATTAVPTTLHHHDDDDEDGHSSGDEAQLPMTWDEKKILSQNINLLPSDCVPEIVNIVQSHEPNVGGDANDEFELDFDKLSTRTLRALDRYVRSNLPASG